MVWPSWDSHTSHFRADRDGHASRNFRALYRKVHNTKLQHMNLVTKSRPNLCTKINRDIWRKLRKLQLWTMKPAMFERAEKWEVKLRVKIFELWPKKLQLSNEKFQLGTEIFQLRIERFVLWRRWFQLRTDRFQQRTDRFQLRTKTFHPINFRSVLFIFLWNSRLEYGIKKRDFLSFP